jgi:hypothetical protein
MLKVSIKQIDPIEITLNSRGNILQKHKSFLNGF